MLSKLFKTVATMIGAVVQGVKAYHRYHQNYRELLALDDRQLADIGLSRSVIRNVAITGAQRVGETAAWGSNPVGSEHPKRAA